MLLRYFYDERLAQASYLIGCTRTGEAMVVDPARNVTPYLEMAQREGLRVTHVTETHIHADFVSGSRELGSRSDATIYLSDTGPAEWKYGYAHEPNVVLVQDGDAWSVGNIRVQVLATPGHTPEHISLLITDTANADAPIGIFTGDFLFVGDVGRPDLLEKAAGMADTTERGAQQQFVSVQKIKQMDDYLQIWPAHGAGSACGKALGAIPSTTLGYEKRFNPAFRFGTDDEAEFVRWLLHGQPEAPRYFARMKHVNKVGPQLLNELTAPQPAIRATLDAAIARGELVADLRPAEEYNRGHLRGSINIPATSSSYTTYLGWFVRYDQPLHLILPSHDEAHALRTLTDLRAIGIDDIGILTEPAALTGELDALPATDVREVVRHMNEGTTQPLDVRGLTEFEDLHVRGAMHIPLGFLPTRLNDLPRDRAIAVYCASGYRAHIATSLLRAHGFRNVECLCTQSIRWANEVPSESSRVPITIA
jgi:hydroxyacylglutathione hydrolase